MNSKCPQLLVAASLVLCLVNVHGLSGQDKTKVMDACKKIAASDILCEKGVEELDAGLSKNPHDYNPFLDTLGFRVPKFQGGGKPYYSVFWSQYDGENIGQLAKALSKSDAKFYTSFNILPGAVINDVGGELSVDVGDFWKPFSAWMAKNTKGSFALWLTGGTEKGFLPPTRSGKPSIFEEYELPNLKVATVAVLHLPKTKSSVSECSADKLSYQKLEEINNKISYYCCELPAYDQYKGSPLVEEVAPRVSKILDGFIAEAEALKVPKECIHLKKHFSAKISESAIDSSCSVNM